MKMSIRSSTPPPPFPVAGTNRNIIRGTSKNQIQVYPVKPKHQSQLRFKVCLQCLPAVGRSPAVTCLLHYITEIKQFSHFRVAISILNSAQYVWLPADVHHTMGHKNIVKQELKNWVKTRKSKNEPFLLGHSVKASSPSLPPPPVLDELKGFFSAL